MRKLVLASSAPKGAAGMHGWAADVIEAVGKPELDPAGYLRVFFANSESSQRAAQQVLERMLSRTSDPDKPTTWQTRQAQYDAVCAWGIPNHALLQRLGAIDQPVFVANGDSDPMILPHYSHLLAGLIPQARVKVYPDSAHGFLFQHHAEFAADVDAFLAGSGRVDAAETSFGSASDLASAFRRAEAAHGEHEKRTGQRDENWPDWYAAYMIAEQSGAELPK